MPPSLTLLLALLLAAPAVALDRPFWPPDFHPPVPVLQYGKTYSFKGYLRAAGPAFTLAQIEGSVLLPGQPHRRVRLVRLERGVTTIDFGKLFALLRRTARVTATGVMRPATDADAAMEVGAFRVRGQSVPEDLPLERARVEAIAADAVRRQDPWAHEATYEARYLDELIVAVERRIADHTRTYYYDALDGTIEAAGGAR